MRFQAGKLYSMLDLLGARFVCDSCEAESKSHLTPERAKESAEQNGWVIGEKDLCPKCKPKPTEQTYWAVDSGLAQIKEVTASAKANKEEYQKNFPDNYKTVFVATEKEAAKIKDEQLAEECSKLSKQLRLAENRRKSFRRKYKDIL